MKVLRTPDERFSDLADFPFEPRYAEVTADGLPPLRMHYLDEGPADAAPVLLLHGEPTWSYLYRHMVPVLTAAGHRCVVPDLVGFGRSDKPADPADYSFARLVAWTRDLLFDQLDLRDITYFGQDWGALVGLRLVAADPNRYARVAIGNGGLPTGEGTPTEAFLNWQRFAATSPKFQIGRIVSGGTVGGLDDATIAAYDAPFPDETYMAGARTLPSLVPTSPDDPAHADNVAAWDVLRRFDKPFLCTFSDGDPITKGGERAFIGRIPGTEGQAHTTIEGGGHFLQEDRGPELAQVLVDFIAAT
ncbi:haloalkane dehalogenase [Actinomarinicola tropica]|uniref:Alpha/beta fold hydrolase n=1 Tax=Actinomarinicola tropica TaxID=2789776 RepID=A0A5Q2RMB7_9ACTN|nr:haloalkane dehalogenase [Actinomarinicola tropica]QGG94325.1 alpha/beta fold hydrolase [Actinomarinicola tropica]